MTMMFVSEVFVDYFIKFLVKMHKEQMLESFFFGSYCTHTVQPVPKHAWISNCQENLTHCIIYNHGHNILRLFDTLSNFLFTTSETKRDY